VTTPESGMQNFAVLGTAVDGQFLNTNGSPHHALQTQAGGDSRQT
jgi:hypothetical protein